MLNPGTGCVATDWWPGGTGGPGQPCLQHQTPLPQGLGEHKGSGVSNPAVAALIPLPPFPTVATIHCSAEGQWCQRPGYW